VAAISFWGPDPGRRTMATQEAVCISGAKGTVERPIPPASLIDGEPRPGDVPGRASATGEES